VLQDLGDHDSIECGVGEREVVRVSTDRDRAYLRRDVAGLGHGGEHRADLCHLVGGVVERDDVRAETGQGERVSTAAAAQIEHVAAVMQIQSVQVGGQHGCARRAAR
jgi:hypothetical protein